MARLHAAEKNDFGLPLIGGEHRGEAAVRTLIRRFVARRAGCVVVLGAPAIGWKRRRRHAAQVGPRAAHRVLKRRHEIRPRGTNDGYWSEEPRPNPPRPGDRTALRGA